MWYPQNYPDDVPLARFEVFRSFNCDEIVDQVSQALADHKMEVLRPGDKLDARMNRVELSRCALDYLELRAAVRVDTAIFEDRYLLYTDFGRETETEVLGNSFAVTAETAALYSPTCSAQVRHGANAKHLHLTLDRKALESHLETLTGVTVHGPVIFAPCLSLTTNGGALLKDLIRLHVQHLDTSDDLLRSPLVIANLEDTLMTTLLTFHSHNYSLRFEDTPPALVPRQVKLVEDYIHANADEPLTMQDFVALANVSARSIHHAFRKYRGYSPKSLLMSVRLARARERLLTADVGESVTGIALDCGFAHLGRFSLEYRKRFGESPSSTLRRRQSTRVD
jgi:AraC-like DNA-binding protein